MLRYVGAVLVSVPAVLREGSLAPADRRMAHRMASFRPQPGDAIRVEGAAFSGAREMYARCVYSRRPGFTVAAGETVVDLGANIGLYTTLAAVNGARTISVEAQSGFLPVIRERLVAHGVADRVEIVHALVGANTGVLSTDANRRAASDWGEEPERLGMDELIDRFGLTRIDLLKIDIEGSEFDLFRKDRFLGMVQRLVMEVHSEFGDVASLVRSIEKHGFAVELLDNDGYLTESLPPPAPGYLYASRSAGSVLPQ